MQKDIFDSISLLTYRVLSQFLSYDQRLRLFTFEDLSHANLLKVDSEQSKYFFKSSIYVYRELHSPQKGRKVKYRKIKYKNETNTNKSG